MVNVRAIQDMGAYVHCLEYNNIEGMILLSELSRRRIRSVQKLIKIGRNEVAVVIRVDKDKGEVLIDEEKEKGVGVREELGVLDRVRARQPLSRPSSSFFYV